MPRATRVLAALAIVTLASRAGAQRAVVADETAWPVAIPALGGQVADPGDSRAWLVSTRIDARTVTVTATTAGGSLAVSLRHPRQGNPSCAELTQQALHTEDPAPFRANEPQALRGAPWQREVFHQSASAYDVEFGCVRGANEAWLATALAAPRAGVTLLDTASMAQSLATALAGARRGYPLRLEVSGLELDDPHDDAAWLFTGRAEGFPVPSDAVSSGAGEAGGVTLTVARRAGDCGAAFSALRPALANEGALVDRPGYVPSQFGSRIRRVVTGERMREVYCVSTTRGALLVTSVFRSDDGDAMSRMSPLLRALVSAAGRDSLGVERTVVDAGHPSH